MAHLNHFVYATLVIIEFVCLTIGSHPPAWRRNAGIIPMHAHHSPHQAEEIPADEQAPSELPTDDGTGDPEQASGRNETQETNTIPPDFTSCPPCWMQEQQKQFRIESIKRRILEKLQMTHVPNITGPPPKNPAIRNLLNNYPQYQNNPAVQSDSPQMEYADPAPAQLERILIFAKRPLHNIGTDVPHGCYFNVAEKTVGYHVSSAKLYFYVSPAKVIQNTLHQMSIKMITARPPGHAKLRLVANIKVQLNPRIGEWRSIDFTNVVQGWAAEPETNLGIVLELEDDAGNSVLITDTSTDEPRRPFLQLRLDDNRRVRMKRQSDRMCSEDRQERECCRYPLIVDFQQFGWDWIIAPRTYEANYCFGSCPDHYFYRYPHTQLISQMDRMAVAGPCCSPSKMTSISLLIFDDDGDIRSAELQDMAVQTCDCA